ncbi:MULTISPECIES: alpha/beta hydrolase [Amycolatopsis]|uniref:Alpha/beta hydrolase n=1 Tax=Amycolatopsis albidoflavus TaxID=102226 RepID=A0ABW5IAM8_9PSEU
MPEPVTRLLSGPAITVDGNRLGATAQLLLKLDRMSLRGEPHEAEDLADLRRNADAAALSASAGVCRSVRTEDFVLPGAAGPLRARTYRPRGLGRAGAALLYFHGGGFVLGSLDTHDGICRFLAEHSGIRVIAAEYRLAPENPFPAAVDDASALYRHLVEHAADHDILPGTIAVGGDSAGGNLAAVVAHDAVRQRITPPAFSLLLYPTTDAVGDHRSHELFGTGFLTNRETLAWYRDQYLPDPAYYRDPRVSVLRETAFAGLPPTYIATAGFDPFRDEGIEYARLLERAGVPVIHKSHSSLLHGYGNLVGADVQARYAMREAASALVTGIRCGRICGEYDGRVSA